jgi:hypothetical protein
LWKLIVNNLQDVYPTQTISKVFVYSFLLETFILTSFRHATKWHSIKNKQTKKKRETNIWVANRFSIVNIPCLIVREICSGTMEWFISGLSNFKQLRDRILPNGDDYNINMIYIKLTYPLNRP